MVRNCCQTCTNIFVIIFLFACLHLGRSPEPPALHLGGDVSLDSVSAREGSPVLPLSQLYGVRGPRAIAKLPRGVGLPEEGAPVFHLVHSGPLFFHRPSRPPHPPISGEHGRRGQDLAELDFSAGPVSVGQGRCLHASLLFSNAIQDLKLEEGGCRLK